MKTTLLYNIAKRVAVAAAVFAVIISVLLIANYIQTKSIDPLKSRAISRLLSELREKQDDAALKEQIRALDLLARRAYFTYLWQIRAGVILLIVFVAVMLAALKYMRAQHARLPDLDEAPPAGATPKSRLLSRRWIMLCGIGLFALALLFGILSENELENYGIEQAKAGAAAQSFPSSEEIRKNWPGFRGPEGNGIAYHTDVPDQWDGKTGKNILWKTPLPLPGFNSPILWGDRVFLSGADRQSQAVYGIAAADGRILWQAEINDIKRSAAAQPKPTADTGYAASTMTTDGKRVFAVFATGDIACLDFAGKRVWAKNLGLPENHYGHASSLVVYRDLLLIQYDQNTGGHLLALKTDSGVQVYDIARDVQISWASPILLDTGSRIELILNANPFVIAYDPPTGRELWRFKCMSGEVAPSPAYAAGMVYVVNDYARLAAIEIGDTPRLAWENDENLSEVPSPLAAAGLVFMATSYGAVSCFDGKTGERYWLHEFDQGFYSSPTAVDGKVYLLDMTGRMVIFKAAKNFALIGVCEIGEKAVTIPAIARGRIYIRGEKHLFCVGSVGR